MVHDAAHLDVVSWRTTFVETWGTVSSDRSGRRDRSLLFNREFHADAGRVEGKPSLRWSQLTVRST